MLDYSNAGVHNSTCLAFCAVRPQRRVLQTTLCARGGINWIKFSFGCFVKLGNWNQFAGLYKSGMPFAASKETRWAVQVILQFEWHYKVHTVEPGYNDIGLCDTSSITSYILWYQLIPHC
jgi:hypothetical protein